VHDAGVFYWWITETDGGAKNALATQKLKKLGDVHYPETTK